MKPTPPSTADTSAPSRSALQPYQIAGRSDQPGTNPRESRAVNRVAQRAASSPLRSGPPPLFPQADPTPTPGTALVKLELQPRTDAELATFAESHASAMEGNPWFEHPIPSTDEFDTLLAAFEAKLAELEHLRVLALNLTQQKDQLRRELEASFNQRASYVQLISRGNPNVIATAGLDIRRARIPTKALPYPTNFALTVTQTSGQLLVTWDTVARARSFVVECARLIDGEPPTWTQVYLGGQLRCLISDLTPGHHHAFRIATIGGPEGRSPWSPVVERMVA